MLGEIKKKISKDGTGRKGEDNDDCEMVDVAAASSLETEAERLIHLMASASNLALSDELITTVKDALSAAFESVGALKVLDIQPIDVRYSQSRARFSSGADKGALSLLSLLGSKLRLAVRLSLHKALEAEARASSHKAAGGARASLFQQSAWRAAHATERAERDAEHAVVDWLSPLFDSICETQTQWLRSDPVLNSEAGIEGDWKTLNQVSKVQGWTRDFWGLTHEPYLLSSLTRNAGSPAYFLNGLSIETLTWTWRKLSKTLGKLCILLGPSESTQRLEHVCRGVSQALGLDEAPDKPVAWQGCGHPMLPRSALLLVFFTDSCPPGR